MLFKITKASSPGFHEDNKPCKNAFAHTYETGEKVWVIEINTVEELTALRDEVNEELVIGLNNWITVYDDFIE